ncbi:hypothetical protein C8Q72DRAFT_865848 [Fomitopsis betulina]|nr:hypothetical protein C8Q72DRAFT_865848 [Fomitopsis betulina]
MAMQHGCCLYMASTSARVAISLHSLILLYWACIIVCMASRDQCPRLRVLHVQRTVHIVPISVNGTGCSHKSTGQKYDPQFV